MKRMATRNAGLAVLSICIVLMAGCSGGTGGGPWAPPQGGGGGGGGGQPAFQQCLGNAAQANVAAQYLAPGGKSPLLSTDAALFGRTPFVPGEVLVKPAAGAGADMVRQAAGRLDMTVVQPVGRDWFLLSLADGAAVPDALRALSDLPDVAFVQPNYKYKALDTTPNDPKFGNLWGLKNTGQSYQSGEGAVTGVAGVDMGMPKAWDQITDCGSVVVAVVDSGVYYDQEDLTANMWSPAGGKCTLPDGSEVECPNHGYDFVNGDDDPKDEQGHGTHVAGTIGAVGDNNTGITGVCWKTRIMAVRVLSRIGSGTSAAIAQGIDFAVENGADVINLSLGGGGDFDQVMFESMQRANKKQVIAACAAGNSGSDNDTSPVWPASYNLNNIISVAAIDPTGALTSFSNFGATSVDVAAPGQFIESAYPFTETTLEDDFSDYNGLAAAEWGVSQCDLGSEVLPILSNPPDWCAQPDRKYLAGQTMDAYKVFDLSAKGGDIVLWSFLLGLEVADTDEIRAGIDVGGGPPFDQDDIVLRGYGTTLGFFFPFEFDATECKGAPCSAGFQLESAQGSTTGHGAGVILNSFTFKTFNPSTYKLSDGTSMAAPHVAGLAAMLKAAYPKATMKDVILAIFQGGQPAAPASLRGAANGLCTGGYATADGALERLAAIMKEKAVQ